MLQAHRILLGYALLFGTALAWSFGVGAQNLHRHQFAGLEAALELAVEDDDPVAIETALRSGASANAHGARGVTPVEYAVGTFKKRAVATLLARGANPNLKDDQGDNAVTLAVVAYRRDPALLAMVLDAGGDPNARRPDGDPVIERFLADKNFKAIDVLHARGADINALGRAGRPVIVEAASALDWDVVWHLIQLGADLDKPKTRDGLVYTFRNVTAPPPGSPLYDDKVKVWRLLVSKGLQPMRPVDLVP